MRVADGPQELVAATMGTWAMATIRHIVASANVVSADDVVVDVVVVVRGDIADVVGRDWTGRNEASARAEATESSE